MSDYEGSVNSDNSDHDSSCSSRIVSRSRRCSDDDAPRQKKRKMEPGYDFIIREAEVDDEPEDDEEWEEGAEEMGIVRNDVYESGLTAREIEGRRRETKLWETEDAIEEYFTNKYVHKSAAAHRCSSDGSEISDEITQQKLLPSTKDPNLWILKCRIGEEKATALLLMRKFFTYQFSGESLQIKSVVVREGLKGYIYIESYKQSHVTAAIQNVSSLRMGTWKQQMVPIAEMTAVLRIVKEQTGLKVKQWVMPKRGLYKDDIAQVHYVDLAKKQVHLKLLPRIDYTMPRGALITAQNQSKANKRMKKRSPAKPFNPEAIRAIGGEVTIDGDFFIFERNRYSRSGFLIKSFTMSAIITEGVQPTLSELDKFEETPEDVDIELRGAPTTGVSAGQKTQTVSHPFSTGDNVEVCEGELMNLLGKIVSIDRNIIMVMPKHKDLKQIMEFQASELRKYFTVGDQVKVIAGRYKGDTGLIVHVKENHVVIFGDQSMRDLEVLIRDLQLCSDVATGMDSLGQFQCGDLVQLDPQTMGVIVRLEREYFQVLSMHGKIVKAQPQSLKKHRGNPNTVGLDSQKNSIQRKDIVAVVDGPHSASGGQIKHIYRNFAFLHSTKFVDNGGVFVCKTRHLLLTGGSKLSAAASPTPCISSSMRQSVGGDRGGSRGGGRGVGARRDRELIGSMVKITSGSYKGHVGIVRDASENITRIELHTSCQTVAIDRSRLTTVGEPTKNGGFNSYGLTPAYGTGSQTPMYSGNGMTPMHGSETPQHGSMTPSHDAGSRTPRQSGDAWDPTVRNTPTRNRSVTAPARKSSYSTPRNSSITAPARKSSYGPARNRSVTAPARKSSYGPPRNSSVTAPARKSSYSPPRNSSVTAPAHKSSYGPARNRSVTAPARKSSYGRTPAYGTGSQTPMYSGNGMTPMHGSEPPHHGSMTPSHDADSRTPRQSGDAWDPTVKNTPARDMPEL